MSLKNNINWKSTTDNSVIEILGNYIRHHRLEQNKSQAQLADEAGIDRTTLVEFEKGRRANLITFIQLLRALGLLHVMEQFVVQQQISPLQLAELDQAKRQRA